VTLPSLVTRLAIAALRITSSDGCPTSSEVEQALAAFGSADSANSDRQVVLTADHDTLVVALRGADGERLAARELDCAGNCRNMAGAVAIVIVAWEAALSPKPEIESEPIREAGVAAQPDAVGWSKPASEVATPLEQPPKKASMSHFELGAGPLVSVVSNDAAPAGIFFGELDAATAPWGGVFTLGVEGTHGLALPTGSSSWQRVFLSLGGVYRLVWRWGSLDTDADGVVGLILAHGHGLATDATGSAFDPGIRLGTRLLFKIGVARLWVGVWGLAFPHSVHLVTVGTDVGPMVPRLELQTGVGASVFVF
jgi:hypothetical protein